MRQVMSRWASVPSLRVRFQGITPASKGANSQEEKLRRFVASGAGAFGAPSAWLFLVRLLASRAGLRFTRHYKVSFSFVAVNYLCQPCVSQAGPTFGPANLLYPRSRSHE